ncbi:NAD(P)-dependent oxidoreductase [Aquibium microcysteis]|uniref:NAD(P)-dependent oxidoreductase n=1 Tax=Aquibium microcysteis TaxID=675281 RepID=UPI00165CF580
MPDILSTNVLHPQVAEKLRTLGSLRFASAYDPDTLLAEGRDADLIVVRAPLPPALFERAPRLRAAIRHGAGLDMIPMDAATKAGVIVANTPGANARTVAEYVFFAAMTLLRRFRVIDRDLRADGWNAARRHADLTRDLDGLTLGIVGFGNIGRQVHAIARHGYGLDVLIHSRSRRDIPADAEFVGLDDLAARCDVMVLCCPLTEETRGLVGARVLGRMKPDALVINISRGPVVDDDAMLAALREGRIGGAALDVFDRQPLPDGHPYLGFDNVVVTPHMSGITEGSMRRMGMAAAEEAARVLRGELPENLCNPEALPAYRRRFPA